jgi:hypothetical protein
MLLQLVSVLGAGRDPLLETGGPPVAMAAAELQSADLDL